MNSRHRDEERLLCLCARQALTVDHAQRVAALCRNANLDWSWIYKTAVYHLVAPLVHHSLERAGKWVEIEIPADIRRQFKQTALHNIVRETMRRRDVGKALRYLNDNNLDVMLVKSIALNRLVYELDWYTTPGDVDLLLRRPLSQLTAKQRAAILAMGTDDIECDGFAHHDLNLNGSLPINFEQIWRDARETDYDGRKVFVMSPEDLLLTLCVNSYRKRYFRLKSLCDLAETVQAYPDLDWHIFTQKAHGYGVTHIVYAALWIAQQKLAFPLPDLLWANLKIYASRAWAIRWLSRRLSLSASTDTGSGITVLGRRPAPSLLLRYATLRWPQIYRNVRFVLRTPQNQIAFWDGS